MESLTKREIFDKAKEHMLKQKMKSAKGAHCLYRGPAGLKCGVGCLITDEAYSDKMESKAVFYKEVVDALSESGIEDLGSLRDKKSKMYMLDRIQQIHDTIEVSDWRESFNNLEKECFESL